MFHDQESARSRPRANTTTFSAFASWRKKPDQSTTPPAGAHPSPPPLQLDELIQALTPPAVPSLAYARSLATGLSTHSPIPRHAALNPILATLCSAESPVALQCAGFEILAAYCENPEAVGLGTPDRLAYFSFFVNPATLPWGVEIWEPRFKALRALIRSGADALGIEIRVLEVLKTWISSAFDSLVMDLAMDRADRAERERSVTILTDFLTAMVNRVEFMARIPEDELVGVLHFYARLVERAMDVGALRRPSLSSPPAEFTPNTSPARPFQNHRRNPSSVSVTSSISSPPVTPGIGSKLPSDIAIAIYLNHLTSQLKTLSSTYLDLILPFLFRALAHCASTLPRLTVATPTSRSNSSETKINETLNSLLSGPYATTCMIILRKNLYPPARLDNGADDAPVNDKTLRAAIQSAFGAHRTLRGYIRRALSARLARAYISSETSGGYSHSGAPAHMEIAKDLMEQAWPSADAGINQGWDAGRLGRPLSASAQEWVAFCNSDGEEIEWQVREGVERVLDEVAGALKDVLQEVDARDEDNAALTKEEAAAVGQTLFHLAEYLLPLKNHDGTPFKIPLSRPADAPTNFLRTLTFILSRDHSMELKPLLSRILLHVADHIADADTAKLPIVMAEQNDLTPISPDWLEHWESLLKNPALVSAQRPLTKKAVMSALESVHESIRDMPSYRRPLAQLVMEACKRSTLDTPAGSGDGDDCEVMWKILGEEIVFRTVEDEGEDLVTEYLDLFVAAASQNGDEDDDDLDAASVTTAGTHSPAPYAGLITPSTTASPILSRMQSEFHGSSPTGKEKDKDTKDSGLPGVMSSFISSLTSGNSSRSQSIQPVTLDTQPEEYVSPSPPEPQTVTCDVAAVSGLVIAFSQLVFTPHALEATNLQVAVRVFRLMLQLLEEVRSAKVRLALLQFMMRLRADRDHRLYFISADYDAHGVVAMLGSLIHRMSPSPEGRPPMQHEPTDFASDLRPARPRIPHERDGRRPRGRGGQISGSGASRSRSRPGAIPPHTPLLKAREPLWGIPETLPFTVVDADTPSEGLALYDPVGPENSLVLPISLYLTAIYGILEKEHSWEVLSYVLCHLPNQLANKHLFCGPMSRMACSKLLTALCTGILNGDLGSHVERWPGGLKVRDAHGLAFHTLSVLVGYQRCFDMGQQHLLVEVFQRGLDGQPATIKCCLHALSVAAFELTSSMTKCLTRILEKLSQIMSNPDMAVHILGLLSIIGSVRPLYANFTDADYKMVFGVALQYLQHHNMNRDAPTESWALSEHVRILSYYIVYVWFLALKLPDRKKHVPYITRQLHIANEGKEELDGPTLVCFDWLERYTYASADPRPATSLLNEIVMNPTTPTVPSEDFVEEKTWAVGNSLVTIRTLRRLGWFEVLSRRPSGYTKLLCRLENAPMVGPGDVEPDLFSIPAALIMERGPARVEPHPPADQEEPSAAADESSSSENVREIFTAPDASETDVPTPDPLIGYVWSGSAPSQRRKLVEIEPSFIALQLSDRQHPATSRHQLINNAPNLASFFRSLDRIPVIDTHKVGIMYVAPGQSTELEILSNTHGSPAYTRFLEGIGRLINLRGQVDVYAGGLDPDEDGEYAYAWWDDIGQVLYHTATMMPSNPHDPQFTNKKRHIGNDFVRIVWNDSGKPYRFDTLTTQFQFVNIVIEPHSLGAIAAFSNNIHENEYFKLTVQRAPDMPDFAPVGNFKLISAKNLPLLVRQLSLLADWFASVFSHTQRDTQRLEITTNWHSRLDAIRRFRSQQQPAGEDQSDPMDSLEAYRDFTTAF